MTSGLGIFLRARMAGSDVFANRKRHRNKDEMVGTSLRMLMRDLVAMLGAEAGTVAYLRFQL